MKIIYDVRWCLGDHKADLFLLSLPNVYKGFIILSFPLPSGMFQFDFLFLSPVQLSSPDLMLFFITLDLAYLYQGLLKPDTM